MYDEPGGTSRQWIASSMNRHEVYGVLRVQTYEPGGTSRQWMNQGDSSSMNRGDDIQTVDEPGGHPDSGVYDEPGGTSRQWIASSMNRGDIQTVKCMVYLG